MQDSNARSCCSPMTALESPPPHSQLRKSLEDEPLKPTAKTKPTLVVVGGGPAGSIIARYFDKYYPDLVHVVLVDPKEVSRATEPADRALRLRRCASVAVPLSLCPSSWMRPLAEAALARSLVRQYFEYTPLVLRAAVMAQKEYQERMRVLHTEYIRHGTHVMEPCQEVCRGYVKVGSSPERSSIIPFDYCVICTVSIIRSLLTSSPLFSSHLVLSSSLPPPFLLPSSSLPPPLLTPPHLTSPLRARAPTTRMGSRHTRPRSSTACASTRASDSASPPPSACSSSAAAWWQRRWQGRSAVCRPLCHSLLPLLSSTLVCHLPPPPPLLSSPPPSLAHLSSPRLPPPPLLRSSPPPCSAAGPRRLPEQGAHHRLPLDAPPPSGPHSARDGHAAL